VKEIHAEGVILDGELAVTDHMGRTIFADLMQRRNLARYFAFDLLWLNGEDLRHLPLVTRKEKLKRILPSRSAHVLYVDHSRDNGTALYRLACQLDLEGIVAKRADSIYDDNPDVGTASRSRSCVTVRRKGDRTFLNGRGEATEGRLRKFSVLGTDQCQCSDQWPRWP
jgi:hypothetical protein